MRRSRRIRCRHLNRRLPLLRARRQCDYRRRTNVQRLSARMCKTSPSRATLSRIISSLTATSPADRHEQALCRVSFAAVRAAATTRQVPRGSVEQALLTMQEFYANMPLSDVAVDTVDAGPLGRRIPKARPVSSPKNKGGGRLHSPG